MTIKIFLFFRFLLQLKKKNEELEIQAIISEFNTFSNIIKKKKNISSLTDFGDILLLV